MRRPLSCAPVRLPRKPSYEHSGSLVPLHFDGGSLELDRRESAQWRARSRSKSPKYQLYSFHREFQQGGIHTKIDGRPIVNFSSNDYLGSTNHPKVKEAARLAVDKYACGLSSSRLQATTEEHVQLEKRFAQWMGFESCLLFTTGYQAMVGRSPRLRTRTRRSSSTRTATPASSMVHFSPQAFPKNGPEIRFFNHNSAKSLERILATRERRTRWSSSRASTRSTAIRRNLAEFVEAVRET